MKNFEYFLAGIFAALGALLLEIILDFSNFQFNFSDWAFYSVAIYAVVEESAKFFAIRRKIILADQLKSVLYDCFWLGLGFGLLELGISALNKNAIYAGNIAAILAVILVHIATSLLTGLFLVKLKTKGYLLVLAVIPSLILHLAFNYWVLTH